MLPLGLKTNSVLNIGELPTSCGLNCVWMKKHEYAWRTKYLSQKYPSCPLNLCSQQTPATRIMKQSLLRLAGSKLKQENTQIASSLCSLLLPVSALGFSSPEFLHLTPRENVQDDLTKRATPEMVCSYICRWSLFYKSKIPPLKPKWSLSLSQGV